MPTASATFGNLTDGYLDFTNVRVDEVGIGTYGSFVDSGPFFATTGTPDGIGWAAFQAFVLGAGSSQTLTFNYDVASNASGQLITSFDSQYTFDQFFGTGLSATATANIYDLSGNLIGSQTFSKGGSVPAALQFTQGQTQVHVTLTVIESIDGSAAPGALIDMSSLKQYLGTTDSGQLASIGDFVFVDMDGDGIQSGGEMGFDGVTVQLMDATGTTVLGSTVTHDGGYYSFDYLRAGSYTVHFLPVAGLVYSPQGQGGNGAFDSDPNPTTGMTSVITLTAGQVYSDLDAGLTLGGSNSGGTATIGNFVWDDVNGNGIQDGTEAGITGVTVNLLDASGGFITQTTTNGSGQYSFTNLSAGTYKVQFVASGGYVFTTVDQGTDAVDSDADASTNGITGPITLTTAEVNGTIDAGLRLATGAIGDRVWNDANGNGIQDGTETGLSGVTVNLMDASGTTVLATDVTDGSGIYGFNGLLAGSYTVQFVGPSGYVFTGVDQGVDTADSDANQASGLTGQITLTAGQTNTTVDAGLRLATGSIGDRVWNDANGNGIQDSTETGLGGVTVNLLDSTGTVIDTEVTAADGSYAFTSLLAGSYQVQFGTLTNYVFTTRDATADTADSDANGSGLTGTIVLGAGETNTTVDAGLTYCVPATASIGNYVWYDCNGNGLQDSGESGLSGVTVSLMNSAGTSVLATTTTSSTGFYQFTGLNAGTYQVQFGTKTGYQLTTANVGSNDNVDSDASVSTRLSGPITLSAGQTNTTVDAGMVQVCAPATATIGNFVWNDCDKDGIQDSCEYGIGGVAVQLRDQTGNSVLATTTTSSSGYYQFSGLQAGTYQVYFGTKSGYVLTSANVGANDSIDSDANTSTRLSGPITLSAGQTNTSVDAGMYVYCAPSAVVGNFVWNDCDKDGIQDSCEYGIGGVTVKLLNGAGTVIGTTTTSSSGYYQFSGLSAGSYQVQVVAKTGYVLTTANAGSNDSIDSDVNSSTGLTSVFTLADGQVNNTIDAGMYVYCAPPAANAVIGNYVWNDVDKDGIQDSCETGLSGVTVKLLNGSGTVIATTTTSSTGAYQFTGLAAGTYQVQVIAKSGYTLTTANVGSNDSVDSDVSSTTGLTGAITLTAGQVNTTVDAGMYATPTTYCDPNRMSGLSAGFWSTHLEAWDGAADTKYANLVKSGDLKSTDILRNLSNYGACGPTGAVGVLLGDSNGNGRTDTGETTLFVGLKAAQQIINSSVSATDTRQILARQAIAAQLNIYNGDKSAGGLSVGADLISKAVQWLKGDGVFLYSDGSSGDIDRVGNVGVLDSGTSGSIDFNTNSAAFTSAALSSSKYAWLQDKSLGVSDFTADGEELKNALQAFNEDRLVTSTDGTLVGWNNNGTMTNLHANDANGLWTVLRGQSVI